MWLSRTVAAGAQTILVWVSWPSVAPERPLPGSDPSDPANPAYNWGTLDATVRAAVAHRLTVVLSITHAPVWAEGPDQPATAIPGTWRPNAAAAGAFAKAVARRYSGSFNPGTGVLPRVRYFQAWTEPNLPNQISPQWVRTGGRWVAESPTIYRSILNADYTAIKSVNSSDVVITGGTSPYGDNPGGQRMRPALFWQNVLCLTAQLKPARCSNPAHFDILAHDPYSFGGPLKGSRSNDVTLADMWRLTRLLTAADRTGRALPRIQHPVWVTEFGWNSRPPKPGGVPLGTRARWIDQAFYELWREGISNAMWYLIVDMPPAKTYVTWQTGLYYDNGRRKPDYEAFRFPFIAKPLAKGRMEVWAVPPRAGTVRVQVRKSGRWTTALSLRARPHVVIDRALVVPGRPMFRAVVGSDVSLPWRP